MRLICPNCSAQYEIDETLVPDEGRDVQCSNCGHTWFELPPPPAEYDAASGSPDSETDTESSETLPKDAAPEPPAEETGTDDGAADDDTADNGEDDAPSHAALAMAAASEDGSDDDKVYDEPAEPTGAEPPRPPRRPADPAALEILKEEAEREMSRRRAPPSEAIETQTDMGLDDIRRDNTPSRALKARMATINEGSDEWPKSEPATVPSRTDMVSEADYQAPRRDLLPDIDEINSTLKSTRTRKKSGAEATARHQKGFRTGFLLMAFLAIAMVFAYAQAPAIARALPGSETALIPYVDGANVVRDWVSGLIGNGDS